MLRIVFVLLFVTIFSCNKNNSYEKESFKIKGFYLEMSVEDVVSLLNDKYSEYFWKKHIAVIYEDNSNQTTDTGKKIQIDKNKKVALIYEKYGLTSFSFKFKNNQLSEIKLNNDLVKYLFNLKHLNITTFVQNFIDSYNIPKMDYFTINKYHWGYEYLNTLENYELKIIVENVIYFPDNIDVLKFMILTKSEGQFGD